MLLSLKIHFDCDLLHSQNERKVELNLKFQFSTNNKPTFLSIFKYLWHQLDDSIANIQGIFDANQEKQCEINFLSRQRQRIINV